MLTPTDSVGNEKMKGDKMEEKELPKSTEIDRSKLENPTLPLPYKKGRSEVRNEAFERRMKIFEFAKKVGIGNLDVQLLAKQYSRADRIILKDIKWIKGHIHPDTLREAEQFLKLSYDKLKKETQFMLAAEQDPDRKIKIMAELRALNRDYIDYLEKWGIKEKIAEKVNVSGNAPAVFNLIEKSVEEIKN